MAVLPIRVMNSARRTAGSNSTDVLPFGQSSEEARDLTRAFAKTEVFQKWCHY